jgi:hypothetical protein
MTAKDAMKLCRKVLKETAPNAGEWTAPNDKTHLRRSEV